MNLELHASTAESHLVVAVRGQLDAIDAAPAAAAIVALMTAGQLVILDLAALDFIDCFALRALMELRARFLLAGGEILIAAPSVSIQRLLSLTSLDAWFSVHRTVASAVASARSMAIGR